LKERKEGDEESVEGQKEGRNEKKRD
jgi:hypothetical protein